MFVFLEEKVERGIMKFFHEISWFPMILNFNFKFELDIQYLQIIEFAFRIFSDTNSIQ